MHKVLITGITGFIGSKIAEVICQNNIEIIGLKRKDSSVWRCAEFSKNITWVDIDEANDWKQIIIEMSPNVIIHSAWIGVEAKERDDHFLQVKNIIFLMDLFSICDSVKVNKFIFLGSQAEYGNIDGKINEDQNLNPVNAYAAVKIACLQLLKTFCDSKNINWIWLRIFSVFGEKESEQWLIPSLIRNMKSSKEMDFTSGEQMYAYMYILDVAKIL